MEKLTGKVLSTSKDNTGLKLDNGNWYNLSQKVQDENNGVDLYKKTVTVETNKNFINKLTIEPTPDTTTQSLEQARSMSISYAKDLAVAGKIAVAGIIDTAEIFRNYIQKGEKPIHNTEMPTGDEVQNENL